VSVVVYKDGVLAADSKAWGGRGNASPGTKRKVHRLPDGTRVGIVSAVVGLPERFVGWLIDGADPLKWTGDQPDLAAIIVKPNGEVFLAHDSVYCSGPLTTSQHAIGSGSDYALGALEMGATIEQAIVVACRLNDCCGLPVHILQPEA
jgi:hypothetical protein